MTNASIYWHDYETWGAKPQMDPPCQFAGIRTDLELNIISEPLMIYSKIPSDYIPHPQACLITGITPQLTLQKGLVEAEFIKLIHEQFSQPNTCVAGYNSLRFDDEVTRYTLYRNFYDPYEREWQNGNSRWDIIDLLRACYALRPEGIEWPINELGLPSFRLGDLCSANGIEHESAHDAMSDVYATIGLAKLVQRAQPRLYDYLFKLRAKAEVIKLINCNQHTPLVHVSSKISSKYGCCTWVVPLAWHPNNKNAFIALNLALDVAPLLELSTEQMRKKMYQSNQDLAFGEHRLGIKLIHINKCPVLVNAKALSEENAQRLNIDRNQCLRNLKLVQQHPEIISKVIDIFAEQNQQDLDPDYALYSGGFLSSTDKHYSAQVREASLADLTELTLPFEDKRLATLLFRYRARNYLETLNETELARWQLHRMNKLTANDSSATLNIANCMREIEALSVEYQNTPEKLQILKSLYRYLTDL